MQGSTSAHLFAPPALQKRATHRAPESVASLILQRARSRADHLALVFPSPEGGPGPSVTYAWLARRIVRFATGLSRSGLRPGDRVALLAPPSPDVYALMLALDASGMVSVVIEGAARPRRVLEALRRASPRAIVGSRSVLRWWPVVQPLRRARRFCIDRLIGCDELALLLGDEEAIAPAAHDPEQTALVSFTSGTGGQPKGTERSRAILSAQLSALQHAVPMAEDDVWMTFFPLVALQVLCAGGTAVLPPADLRAPAEVEPGRLVDALRSHRVSCLACAPAVMERLVARMAEGPESLNGLHRVVLGGGPVSRTLCVAVRRTFPTVRADVVYGSTEAEPVATASIDAVIAARGRGCMVGVPVPEAEVAIVRLGVVPHLLGRRGLARFRVPDGTHGEIVVRGPHVARRYVGDTRAISATKLVELDGSAWHRTGDVGHLDGRGRLWLTGRVGDLVPHRGATLHPLVVEGAIGGIPGLRRCALVAARHATDATLCVEIETLATVTVLAAVRARLADMGLDSLAVRSIARIPMDARHASKVDRAALRERLASGSR